MRGGRRWLVAAVAAAGLVLSSCATATGGWTIVPVPDIDGAADSTHQVSCVSPTWCVGLGGQASVGDGGAWTPMADQPARSARDILRIACGGVDDCWAIGWSPHEVGADIDVVARHWDGESWSDVAVPVTDVLIGSVECTSTSFCVAVGRLDGGGPTEVVALRWDGTSWSDISPPGVVSVAQLVSCAGPSSCALVTNPSSASSAAALRRWEGGTWGDPRPVPLEAFENAAIVSGIDCPSPDRCVVVGTSGLFLAGSAAPVFARPFVMTDDGTTIARTALPWGSPTTISAVSCSSATACLVTGSVVSDAGTRGAALVGSGSSWAPTVAVPRPGEPPHDLTLGSVSCAGSTCVAAAGSYSATYSGLA